MSIKPPSGVSPPVFPASIGTPQGPPANKVQTPALSTPPAVNPEAVAKAIKDYQKLKSRLKKPFLSGAAGLFADNIVFPADLLDPQNLANDPKYLHLLSAVLGLKDLEHFFASDDQNEEMEEEEEDEEKSSKKPPEKKVKKPGARK